MSVVAGCSRRSAEEEFAARISATTVPDRRICAAISAEEVARQLRWESTPTVSPLTDEDRPQVPPLGCRWSGPYGAAVTASVFSRTAKDDLATALTTCPGAVVEVRDGVSSFACHLLIDDLAYATRGRRAVWVSIHVGDGTDRADVARAIARLVVGSR